MADEDNEELTVSLDELEALERALGLAPAASETTRQGPSPLFLQVRELVRTWEKTQMVELEETCDREAFAEALLEKLVSLQNHRHVGAHLAEWLVDRPEVVDVFATDEELERALGG